MSRDQTSPKSTSRIHYNTPFLASYINFSSVILTQETNTWTYISKNDTCDTQHH